ncbi:MAG TPA: alpha-glucan family phosphorylase [Gemmatimonadales bacterium]|nr:alpha-glucan family phosphorylase [Gemmatimonadales bacterium]
MTQPPNSTPNLPERLTGLAAIAANLSWSWSHDARELFRSLDPALWHLTRHNPIEQLRRVDPARLTACAADEEFVRCYDAVAAAGQRDATSAGTWFANSYPESVGRSIAYFCAEFGLHASVPIYSGGLGLLAGDHCKAASDLGVPLVGVGLFYTKGYSDQRLRLDGWQEDAEERFDVAATPLQPMHGPRGDPCLTTLQMSGRAVSVAAWRVMVGRVPVFLLDTDLEQNDPADRGLSHRLYAGGPDLRVRQEWLLGVGGVRVLRVLGYDPAVWHANEGHAAFMLVERVRELVTRGTPFAEAVGRVRRTSVFTTHTPVSAGHDAFSPEQVEQCTGPVWQEMGVDRKAFFQLGHHPVLDHDRFHMPVAAIRLSSWVNGVSRRHGEESRRIWGSLWPDRETARVPIGQVTNGVHVATWMANPLVDLINSHVGQDWLQRVDDPAVWDRMLELDAAALWAVHAKLKAHLLRGIREQARRRWADQWKEASHLVGAGTLLDHDALTIGFGRRFATYKRADLIFRDLDRLQRLLVNPWRPVQIVFAGKAHPGDEPGKQILQRVYAHTREARFEGRLAFIEDYDMHLAHGLVQGVDLWLNVPRPPLEACGTSGMKAGLNGVPQLSTLDGWWAEGYDGPNGWAISATSAGPPAPADQDVDAADAEQLYRLLEDAVVPLFYERDAYGVPRGWVDKMKHALRMAGARFTARRMVRQYLTEYYVPAMRGDSPADDPPTA